MTLRPGERATLDGVTLEFLSGERPHLRIDGTEYPLPPGREPRHTHGYGPALGWGIGLFLVGGAVAAFGEVKSSSQYAPESKGARRTNAAVIGGILAGSGIIGGAALVKKARDQRAAEVREEVAGPPREITTLERDGVRYAVFASVRATWTGKQRAVTAVVASVRRAP